MRTFNKIKSTKPYRPTNPLAHVLTCINAYIANERTESIADETGDKSRAISSGVEPKVT